jgi:hypothetical protein
MSGDRTCVISADLDGNIFVWSLDWVHLQSTVWWKLMAGHLVILFTVDLTLLGSHSSIWRRA